MAVEDAPRRPDVPADAPAGGIDHDHRSAIRAAVVDAIDHAVIATDMQGRIVVWNRAATDLYGWRADEVLGHVVHEVVGSPRSAEQAAEIMAILLQGKTWHGEFEVRRRDGRTFTAYVTDSPVMVGDRQVGVVGVSRDVSGSAQLRRELEDRERQLNAMFDSTAIGMAVVSLDGGCARVNDALCRFTGRAGRDLIGRSFAEIVGLEAEGVALQQLLAPVDGTPGRPVEARLVRGDGSVAWGRVSVARVVDDSGAHEFSVATVDDVTERRTAEDAARAAAEFTHRVLDGLFAFVGVLTPDGTLIEANRAPLDIAGITADDVIGKKFWDCYWWTWSPEAQERLRDAVDRARGGEVVRYDTPVRIAGDGRLWIDFQLAPLHGPDGTVTHLIPSGTDLTARRQTMAALEESEKRFRTLADNLPLIVWVHGPDGAQEWVNQTYCDVFGVTREEMQGGRWQLLTHPDDGTAYADEFVRCIGSREPFHAEVRAKVADGRWRWLESWGTPRWGPDGEFLGIVGTSVDVTERKAAEASLRQRADTERRERQRARLVADIVSYLEPAETVTERAHRLVELLVAHWVDAASIETTARGKTLVAASHRDAARRPDFRMARDPGRRTPAERELVARVAAGHELIGSLGAGPAADATEAPDPFGFTSHLAVPLDLGGSERAALILARSDPAAPPLTEEDLTTAREVARQAGVLLARAKVRDEEHEVATRLQEALLPDSLVDHPLVRVAARYEAAEGMLRVGGDWYDSFELPDGRLGFAVGDVVGHGLESAAAMGRMRAALAALAPLTPEPAELVERFEAFARGPNGVPYATLCYAVVDPQRRQVTYAAAGHPPPLLVSPDGHTELLNGGRSGPLLRFELVPRRQDVADLPAGSLLVLYSDGLVERRNRRLTDGLDALLLCGQGVAGLDPDAAADRLVAGMLGAEARNDDVVVLAVLTD